MPKKVILSNRAYIAVLAETNEKIKTETGGVFLGQKDGDVWYIVEAVDPGPKSIFKPSYFEYDEDYISHLGSKVNRLYRKKMSVLGLWHRHPGTLDRFSSTDDGTNAKYAKLADDGAISAIVNIDPNYRMTMYYVSLPLAYRKIPIEVSDDLIPKEYLAYEDAESLIQKLSRAHYRTNKPEPHNSVPFGSAILEYMFSRRSKLNSVAKPVQMKTNEKDLEKILEVMQQDIDFLDNNRLNYSIKANDLGGLDLRDGSFHNSAKPIVLTFFVGINARPFFKWKTRPSVLFELDGTVFEYEAGLIKRAYLSHEQRRTEND